MRPKYKCDVKVDEATTKTNMVPSMFNPVESIKNMFKHSAMHFNISRCLESSKTSKLIRFGNTVHLHSCVHHVHLSTCLSPETVAPSTKYIPKPPHRRHVHPTYKMNPNETRRYAYSRRDICEYAHKQIMNRKNR